MKKLLLFNLLFALVIVGNATAQKTRKVLIIGIDGTLNAGLTQAWAPNIYALMNDGHSYVSTDAQTDIPTISGNGWSGIMTGVGVSKHRQPNNTFQANDDYANYPAFYKEIVAKYPTLRTSSIASWLPINKYINNNSGITYRNTDPTSGDDNTNPDYVSDEIITVEAIAELQNENPGVLFVHLDDVDAAGHNAGFSVTNSTYTAAITLADSRVKRIFDALKARPSYNNEDWLIALTTDHGGKSTSHGGSSYQERNTFIILNNIAITPTLLTAPAPVTVTENVLYFPGTGSGNSSNGGGTNNSGMPDLYAELPLAIKNKINFGSESFTIQAKVRMLNDAADNFPPIISDKNWNSGGNPGFALAWHSGALRFNFVTASGSRYPPSGTSDMSTAIALSDKQWHYVTIVVDRVNKKIFAYEEGTQSATKDIAYMDAYTNTTTALPINLAADGDANFNTKLFKGNITQVRIFKGALSATEVASTWSKDSYASTDTRYSDLVFYNTGLTFNAAKDGLISEPVDATNGVADDVLLKSGTSVALPTTMATQVSEQFAVQHAEQGITFPGTKTGNKPNLYGELPKASTTDKVDFGTEDFTIQLRVKMNNSITDLYPPIISNKDWDTGANTGFALAWHTKTLKFNFTTTTGTRGTDLDTQIDLNDKRWHYVTIVVKRSNGRIYAFDGGVLTAIKDIAYMNGLNATTAFPINIAADGMAGEATTNYSDAYFNGNINHIRIFKGALSEKEIRANWKNDNLDATAPEWSKLVFYNKGDVLSADKLSGIAVNGGANTDITLKTNGAGVIPSAITTVTAIQHDELNSPYTYSVPASVLRFLDVPIPASYDGDVLAGIQAGDSPLPVKVISFTGTPNKSSIAFKWTVGTEDNVSHYEVQRGISAGAFVTVATVNASGANTYTTSDNSPLTGVSYYRLKVIDKDGKIKYEDPISVKFGQLASKKSIVFPNPIVGNEVNVQLSGYATGKYNYKIVNTAGALIQSGIITNNEQAIAIKLNSTLASGIYILNITNGTETVQTKLVK